MKIILSIKSVLPIKSILSVLPILPTLSILLILLIQLLLSMSLFLTVPGVQAQGVNIPPNKWTFNEDYFTIYGSPEMVVSLTGSAEYKRDDSSTVLLQVMNQGKVLGFESEHDPKNANEIELSKLEREMEYGITTALGVTAALSAENAPLNIKTPAQSAGSLTSGQVSDPLQFEIEVWKNAGAGSYPLEVELSYQFQKDVYLEGNVSENRIDLSFLYEDVNETHEIFILIKEEANFEVTDVESSLYPGSTGPISMTFKNTGEENASKAMARLRLSDPLSSTDYTAFLEDLEPGEEVRAVFNIEVDSDAAAKAYPIKAEVEYEDSEGETRVSDIIYVPAEVNKEKAREDILKNPLLISGVLLLLAGLAYYYLKKRKAGEERTGEEKTGEERAGEERTGEERTGEERDGEDWSE